MAQLPKDGTYLLYLRKSRADNPDESVEEVLSKHEKLLQDYFIREIGRPIPEDCIYREIVSGGENIADREQMQKVLAKVESPDILGVACADPQRLSRGSLTDCDLLIDTFRYSRTLVITPVMTYDLQNKMERRFFQDELMRGRDYLEYVKEVLYRGRYQSAARGCVVGHPPYGYNKIKIGKDCTLEPNENAEIVQMIFNWYARDLKTPGQIAAELNRMMIAPPKHTEWVKESVLMMLKNIQYDGKVIFGRKKQTVVFENGKKVTKRLKQAPEDVLIVEGKHPAIVDHETFMLAQERIEGRGYLSPKTRAPLTNIYAGMFWCPVCGYAMIYHKRAGGKGSNFFNCKHYCGKALMEKSFVPALKTALLEAHLPELEAKLESGEGESSTIQRQHIERLEKQIADFKKQEVKQYDLLETGIYSDEVFLERNTALREKITSCFQQLEEAKKNLPKSIDYGEKVIALKAAIDAIDDPNATPEQKNKLLKAIIKRIEYVSDKNQPKGTNDFKLSITLNI